MSTTDRSAIVAASPVTFAHMHSSLCIVRAGQPHRPRCQELAANVAARDAAARDAALAFLTDERLHAVLAKAMIDAGATGVSITVVEAVIAALRGAA